ncbi:uncharacterized protein LOC134853924 isoform X2 [Symsagittifera roscoffensis]|uniref:uncharacterized protein LOC134853924 isoform X2 n=1 Tax=Symsagittifera roscoffensis TaxID=84072 RepID=UPI00307B93A7
MERLKASVLCKEVSDLAKDQLDIILDREDLNSDYVSNITDNFEVIKEASQSMVSKLVTIEDNLAPRFDFDENTRANGFWSLCRICKLCLMRLQELINYVTSYHYQSTLLKTKNPLRDLQAYAQCLSALGKCLDFVVANEELFIQGNNLIISLENHPQKLIEELYDSFEELPRAPFYGRTIGFHYDPSLVNPLLAIVVSELSYAELYESNGFARKATAFLSGGKFYLNNKLRGYAMDVLSRLCDMSFGKSFWSLTELNMIQHVPSLVCNSVEVNRVIELEKTTLFMMPPVISAGKMFEPVEVPYPHTSESKGENSPPFFMRLISYLTREGMVPETSVISTSGTQVAVAATGVLQGYPIPTTATLVNPMGAMTSAVTSQATAALTNATKAQKKKNPNIAPLSDAIVIHCHGGGFVSQSSRSHEIYLRSWAKALNIPIVAIDYSLAPEHPFPTAVDESFYCYCWILNNLEKLGCKRSAKICLVGDSAGGNLVLAIALRCIQTYIRKPDGIVAVYPAVFPQYALSPSRVLSVMDCLLAVGILDQCLLAYLGEEDPLPSFKLSRVLEHYQGEWEYRLSEPSVSGIGMGAGGSGLAMLPTLACGSWLYRLVRKPNSDSNNRQKQGTTPMSGPNDQKNGEISPKEPTELESSDDILKEYKLEMVENSDWISISRCSSESSQTLEAAEAVKIVDDDSTAQIGPLEQDCITEQPTHDLRKGSLPKIPDPMINVEAQLKHLNEKTEAKKASDKNDGPESANAKCELLEPPLGSRRSSKDSTKSETKKSKQRKSSNDNPIGVPGSSNLTSSPGFISSRANAARNKLGSSFKQMTRRANKAPAVAHGNLGNNEDIDESLSTDCKGHHIVLTRSISITKSSSLPSLDSHVILSSEDTFDRVNTCKDDSITATHGAKSTSNWFGQVAPAAAVPLETLSIDSKASKSSNKSATSGQSSNEKSQQYVDFENELKFLKAKKKKAILDTIRNPHVKNPLHCPLIASDEDLRKLPPVSILCGAMDPLLDESVVFAKRLKKLNNDVTFDVLESLPHGFLNFVLVSKLCRDASDLCQKRISDVLNQSNSAASNQSTSKTNSSASEIDPNRSESIQNAGKNIETGKIETAV